VGVDPGGGKLLLTRDGAVRPVAGLTRPRKPRWLLLALTSGLTFQAYGLAACELSDWSEQWSARTLQALVDESRDTA
jgi:hypothetical protein